MWSTPGSPPAARLHGALTAGEQLTSLYVRINDTVFDADLEHALADVDLGADPLLRALFDGEFGGYQKAQLHRLLGG